MDESELVIGTILSGATTTRASCLIKKEAEHGVLEEGMLVIIRSKTRRGARDILARVETIKPIDESYEPGGFLTEAIRKGLPIPREISRKYEIAELDLLFGIGRGRREIRYPPLSGDSVLLIKDVRSLASEIFGVGKDDLVIECGALSGYEELNLPVILNVEALPMHVAVFGITGSGKSYNVGALIEKLSEIKYKTKDKDVTKHFPVIAVDPNGDYVDYWDHFIEKGELGAYPQVIRYVFNMRTTRQHLPRTYKKDPVNFLRLFNIDLNEFFHSPRDLAEAIIVYYAADVTGRELQASGLSAVLQWMISPPQRMITDLNVLFTNTQLYNRLIDLIHNPPEGISIHRQTADAIERQLDTFKREVVDNYSLVGRATPFTRAVVDDLVKKGGMVVIDFTVIGAPGFPLHLKQFIVYYIAYVLFKRFIEYKQQEALQRSLLFIIEEAQNYCPNPAEYKIGYSLARDVLQQIATQGRKFGLCLCLVTQRPSYVDPVMISMCNSFIIHRIAPGDETFVRKVTGGLPSSLERKLTRLETGYAIFTGQIIKSGLPILAHIRKGVDRTVEQKAGEVEIAPGLPEKS